MTSYLELKEEKTRLAEKMKDAAAAFLCDAFLNIFKKYPELERFKWAQYTPYFNDGDPCVFGVNTYDFRLTGNVGEDGAYVEDEEDWSFSGDEGIAGAISEALSSVDEEDMKSLFGDHVEVTAHRDGRIETEEYYHD